jgi:3',5'-nucleoside bisphosphate phosphatase
MSMKTVPAIVALLASLAAPATADDRAVVFPNTPDGHVVLAADLHTHSVFSDGAVWPSIRVEEAHRDGLSVLAVTEHLEYQPHKADIPNPDRNRSYGVAIESLVSKKYTGLLIINGAEVTRDQPFGHINAVFLDDANALLKSDPREAIEAAHEQGAFVFVNHPDWLPQRPDGVARLSDYQQKLIADGLLQGIEVANGTMDGLSEHALQIALDNNLTVLGNSDIHGLVDWTHDAGHDGRRPMTLVLAANRSEAAFRTALFEGRTVAWYHDQLMGREDNVQAVVRACLSLVPGPFDGKTTVLPVTIKNVCPLDFALRNTGKQTFQNANDTIGVERKGETRVHVRMSKTTESIALNFDVLNTQIGYRKTLPITLTAGVPAMLAAPKK